MRRLRTSAQLNREPVSPADDVNLSVEWSARLVQPKHMLATSTQECVVQVAGPKILDGPARIQVGTRSFPGQWQGEPDQRRTLVAYISGLSKGAYGVDFIHGPTVLRAGTLGVT